jgi:hypothetical protein
MRHLLNQVSLMLSTVFLVSCASAIPPARIGEYVSSEHQVGGDAFARIDQRPLRAGLVVVSDTAEPGAAPNLPEEALARLPVRHLCPSLPATSGLTILEQRRRLRG